MGRGRQSEDSTAETARKRPERPWTAARTMEVLRRCPLAIAQRLVHCTVAVSTAVLDRVTKTMSVALLFCCWRTTWTTRSKRCPTCSAQLHLPAHDLFWANLGVQLHFPPLRSFDLAWNPVRGLKWRVFYTLKNTVGIGGPEFAGITERRISNRKGNAALSCPCMNREACWAQLGHWLALIGTIHLASGFTWERRLLNPTTALNTQYQRAIDRLR